MERLSLNSYVKKCILGAEVAYVICLLGGFLPLRSQRGIELHHALFETLPGFTWLTFGSFIWGAILIAIVAWVFGAYMVWMHNSSLVHKS
ncbi:MAG: hypothetical protein WC794_05945 [Candidatus Doudnabacteria bacterium]|jgi:uncharacterized membrane protein YvlD (DUF360 family)